jgi:hypothetical protein
VGRSSGLAIMADGREDFDFVAEAHNKVHVLGAWCCDICDAGLWATMSREREHARPRSQPPAASRRYGGGAEEASSAGAGRGHRPPNPAAQGPNWTPRPRPPGPHPARPSSSLDPGARGRTAANIAASGPSDRAAGRRVRLENPLGHGNF